MNAIEHELIEKIHHLNLEQKQRLLEFVNQLEVEHAYTLDELLALPPEERNRRAAEALRRSKNDEVDLFEANQPEDFVDD